MGRRGKVEGLPEEVRRWLERALMDSGFSGYDALKEMLAERGYVMSKSAIHRYGSKIERRFATIKASTEAARLISEQAGDSKDARSEALTALVQTELFEAILSLQEADDPDVDTAERVGLLSSAAKNIATLSRSSVNLKLFQAKVEEAARKRLLEEQRAKLDELGKTGEVPADVLARVIKAAYDL